MKKLEDWVKALVNLEQHEIAACPNCGKHTLDYGYARVHENDDIGYGAVWCNDCHHAFHISRAKLEDKEHILDIIPSGLIFTDNG